MGNGRTVAEDMEREYQRQSLRDTFAAAALTGMMSRVAGKAEAFAEAAYKLADAMLAERSRAGQKIADCDSFCAVCPVRDSSTNNDTATGEPGGSVEFSPGSRTGPINRTPERESPRRECGESSLRDVARPDTKGKVAGGPEHHISEAQIDALEFVVEEGRIANIHDCGHLRSLLVRLRPEWESDRPQPIKDDLSDRSKPVAPAVTVGGVDRPVSYAETDQNRIFYDTKRDTTQPRNGALPTPLAWAVMERDGFGIEGTFTDRDEAAEWCDGRQEIVPLYAWNDWDEIRKAGERISREEGHKVLMDEIAALGEEVDRLRLTDEEREAIAGAIAVEHHRGAWQWADTLRRLLERLK